MGTIQRRGLRHGAGLRRVMRMHALSAKFVAIIAGIGALTSVYAVGYPDAGGMLTQPSATVTFAGDMLFDRYVRSVMEKRGEDYIFSCLGDSLRSADLVVANLEGPITEHASVSVSTAVGDTDNMTFTFPPQTAALLKRQGIHLVNIGNNHILNFGWQGYDSTRRHLEDAGVAHFGDVYGRTDVHTQDIRDVHLAFINYNEYGGNAEETKKSISSARAAGQIPIVYAHWGEEYEMATELQKKLAHEFVEAGAELVTGSHPHVIQEHEVYEGKHIYYSLGNFIFDQYWEESVRRGLLLDVRFSKRGVEEVREVPIELQRDGHTCPIQ